MKTLEESVVIAMDGTDKDLFPFLPYILQDVWEIGSEPETIIAVIKKHFSDPSKLKLLDLGCGKGAVSVKVAKQLNCKCHGIDAVPEFIDFANKKASEYDVDHLCTFEIGDIREKVKNLSGFDVVLLGSIGPVLGDFYGTLSILSEIISKNGVVIIDDGYVENESDSQHPLVQKKEIIMNQIEAARMQLLDEVIYDLDMVRESNDFIHENLVKRCHELSVRYPAKKNLFENYIKKQEEEIDALENKIICSVMVIGKSRV